jgi:hypothetical protein
VKHHRYGDWRAAHYGKRRYRSRRRAWLVIFSIWLRERHTDSLQPYTCRWGPDWNKGRAGEPHIHIGHGRYTPADRARHWVKRVVVWPFYRARARWRRLRRARSAAARPARSSGPPR